MLGAASGDGLEVGVAALAQQLEAGERVDVEHAEVAVVELLVAGLGVSPTILVMKNGPNQWR